MSVESLIEAIDSELNLTELKMILDCVQIRMHEMKEVEMKFLEAQAKRIHSKIEALKGFK